MWFPNTLLANHAHTDETIFMSSITGNTSWMPWTKPVGKTMAFMIAIGAGAGGGGGRVNAPQFQAGGGGSGAITCLEIPLFLLPNTIYIQIGVGGTGANPGSLGGAGGAGALTYISTQPSNAAANLILISGAAAATGGGAPVAGTASTIATATSAILMNLGVWTSIAGQNGTDGSGTGPVQALGSLIVSGGAGSGEPVTGASFIPSLSAGGTGLTLMGSSTGLQACGGGGCNGVVTGAKGGMGSGGGGGTTALAGGRGGDGMAAIWCF